MATTPILVLNYDGDFYALEDKCSHEDYELSAGTFDGEEATNRVRAARRQV
jgi:3-phenylpropionate/trans-cinnamate dioxygenase ferredoxin subunit